MLQSNKEFNTSNAKVLEYNHRPDKISSRSTYSGANEWCDIVRKGKKKALYSRKLIQPSSYVSVLKYNDVKNLLEKLGFNINKLEF